MQICIEKTFGMMPLIFEPPPPPLDLPSAEKEMCIRLPFLEIGINNVKD